jgi:hypothetical protein
VKVAGGEADGVLDEAVDEHANLEALGGHLGLEILNGVTHFEHLMWLQTTFSISLTSRRMTRNREQGKVKV